MGTAEPIDEVHYRRLLVAVDGSRNSDLALSAALSLARRDNATITIVSVEPDVSGATVQWPVVTAPPTDLQSEAHGRCADNLSRAVAAMPEDVPVTSIHRFGKAGPEIIAQSKAESYDVILVGARGVGRVESILGSVSQHVLHHAQTAVLVTHAPRPGDEAT